MPDNNSVYVEVHPGDLISAGLFNGMQQQIKEDIQSQIAKAKQDVIDGGVKRADNADKFDSKSPKDWTDILDQRYAPRVHDHEGTASYRRYFRRMDAEETLLVIEHDLHRFPLVDVYRLEPLVVPPDLIPTPASGTRPTAPQNTPFFLYYGHNELDALQQQPLFTKRLPRRVLGTPWELLLTEVGVQYNDDYSLNDVINDFLDAFFKAPGADEMDHMVSKWIDDHRDSRTVATLKQRGEWDDIRWAVLPRKLADGLALVPGNDQVQQIVGVDIVHLSYDTVAIQLPANALQPAGQPGRFLDLMILLRS
ncbi:MAG: hypothetical protein U0822_24085 [Anaerolineae bacterium]